MAKITDVDMLQFCREKEQAEMYGAIAEHIKERRVSA